MHSRSDKDLERIADKALDRLAHGWDPLSLGAVDDDEAHVVANLEALSLLAYAAEPVAPSAGVKERLLAAVAAESRAVPSTVPSALPTPDPVDVTIRHRAAGDGEADAPRDLPMAESDPGDLTLVGLGAAAQRARESSSFDVREIGHAVAYPAPRAANNNTPLFLLAAGLILCLIGLGFLYGQLQAQNDQSLANQARLADQLEQARSESESLRARIQMVTDVARWAYPMQKAAAQGATTAGRPDPGEVRPDGIVYVCGQHQQWYLSLSGFEPPPEGKVYHLWFKTDHGTIDAGPIDVGPQGRADLSETSMPKGTQGFLVSLEDSAEGSEIVEPHGQIILKGEQPVRL